MVNNGDEDDLPELIVQKCVNGNEWLARERKDYLPELIVQQAPCVNDEEECGLQGRQGQFT